MQNQTNNIISCDTDYHCKTNSLFYIISDENMFLNISSTFLRILELIREITNLRRNNQNAGYFSLVGYLVRIMLFQNISDVFIPKLIFQKNPSQQTQTCCFYISRRFPYHRVFAQESASNWTEYVPPHPDSVPIRTNDPHWIYIS